MAHSEACQLYIEQEIEEGLRKGKTPYSIGKELAGWVERLFEAKIPEKTLRKRAERSRNKLATNVANDATHQRHSEIDEKPSTIERGEAGKFLPGTAPGPGRKAKHYDPAPIPGSKEAKERAALLGSQAMNFAETAILHLEQIESDDPRRVEALLRVRDWIDAALRESG